jgi:hypothetical protein
VRLPKPLPLPSDSGFLRGTDCGELSLSPGLTTNRENRSEPVKERNRLYTRQKQSQLLMENFISSVFNHVQLIHRRLPKFGAVGCRNCPNLAHRRRNQALRRFRRPRRNRFNIGQMRIARRIAPEKQFAGLASKNRIKLRQKCANLPLNRAQSQVQLL